MQKHQLRAFTMIEIVFIVIVIGILAGIAIPKIAATRDDAAIAKLRTDINTIRMAIINERNSRRGEGTSGAKLMLYYNYQPWQDENYTAGNSSILMDNVETFQYQTIGDLIKIQVCVNSNLVDSEDFSVCKEKTVF